jgi:tetratricopeptide (TPR) repeat protein
MAVGFKKMSKKKICRIKYIWLIIITISVVFALNGCSSMRSVRQGSRTSVKKSLPEQNSASEKKIQDDNRQDALPDAETSNSLPNGSNTNKTVKLPTLQQQLTALSSEQQTIKATVSDMQGDINDIKAALADIKDALIRKGIINNQVVKGMPVNSDGNTIDSTKSLPKNVILPDEIAKEQPKSEPQKKAEKKVQQVHKKYIAKNNSHINKENPEKLVNKSLSSGKEAVAESPRDASSPQDASSLSSATQDVENRNFQVAIRKLNRIAEIDLGSTNFNICYFLLGESHFGLGQYEQAINYYKKVLGSRNPFKKDNAQIMVAEAEVRSGRIEEARKAYQAFVAQYPTSEFMPQARKMLQQL